MTDIDGIVGAQRKAALIEAHAERVALANGMSLERARQYAAGVWPDVSVLASPGQVWRRVGPQQSGDLGALLGRDDEYLTITAVDRNQGMAEVGAGRLVSLGSYLTARYRLHEWPDDLPAVPEQAPQPPAASLPPPEEVDAGDGEEPFDPHRLFVLFRSDAAVKVHTRRIHEALDAGLSGKEAAAAAGEHTDHWMPMVSDHYRSDPTKCRHCYVVSLDVPAYLRTHLSDYRAGWPDFADQWRPQDALMSFNELSYWYETDTAVAAYLGKWLWDRVRGDVVREHGGRLDDWDVSFMWAGSHADAVLEAFAYADPRLDLPADHDLMQGAGQTSIFDELGVT